MLATGTISPEATQIKGALRCNWYVLYPEKKADQNVAAASVSPFLSSESRFANNALAVDGDARMELSGFGRCNGRCKPDCTQEFNAL